MSYQIDMSFKRIAGDIHDIGMVSLTMLNTINQQLLAALEVGQIRDSVYPLTTWSTQFSAEGDFKDAPTEIREIVNKGIRKMNKFAKKMDGNILYHPGPSR
ncbi:hypothetical protein V8E54_002804 [Elaphomyces granulatus]